MDKTDTIDTTEKKHKLSLIQVINFGRAAAQLVIDVAALADGVTEAELVKLETDGRALLAMINAARH